MEIQRIYFIGIGGIGMSALARYFLHEGREVAGYDRTQSALTEALAAEGAAIHYTDDTAAIPAPFREREGTVVVYTPAVPDDHAELSWFRDHGFTVEKRSQMLGHLSAGKYVMAVAGTHGKTTTSTLVAWLNREVEGTGSAFLGGISKNFGSNLVLGDGPRLAVEADEFDRSFLRLRPDVAVVTAVDADHLDIYGTHEAVKEAFAQFIERIRPGGALVLKAGVDVALRNDAVTVYRYAYDTPCDFYARDVRLIEGGHYRYDLVTPSGVIADCTLGIPGWVNVENAVRPSRRYGAPPAPKEGRSTQSDCGVRWRPSRGSNAASNSTSIPRGRSTWTTMPTIRANWPPRSPRCGGCFPAGA